MSIMGGEAKVSVMVLKVDLGCVKCCRKIKRVLCSLPQIRNQLFDDKSNTVTVSALCCTPEKVANKIRKKAGGTVKGIDIKPSQPPAKPPSEKPKEAGPPPTQPADKPKQGLPAPAAEKPQSAPPQADKPKSAPPPAEKPKSAPPPADQPKSDDKPKAAAPPPPAKGGGGGGGGGGDNQKPPQTAGGDGNTDNPKKADMPPPPQQQSPPMGPPPQGAVMKPNQPAAFESIPVAGYPSIFPPPVMYYDGGPYYHPQNQQGMMYPQPIYQYDGYQGRPVGDYYGGGRAAYRSDYFTEDNPSTCSVM